MNKRIQQDSLAGLLGMSVVGILIPSLLDIKGSSFNSGLAPNDFPIFILSCLFLFSAVLFFRHLPTLYRRRAELFDDDQFRYFFCFVLPLTILAFAYGWLFEMFQYAVPTFFVMVIMMWMFSNHGWVRLLLTPLIVTLLFYFIFFVLLGVVEPSGTVWSYDLHHVISPIRNFLGLR